MEQIGDTTIRATPVKAPPAANQSLENSTKAVSLPLPQEKEGSIYAALGWDDEVDELL